MIWIPVLAVTPLLIGQLVAPVFFPESSETVLIIVGVYTLLISIVFTVFDGLQAFTYRQGVIHVILIIILSSYLLINIDDFKTKYACVFFLTSSLYSSISTLIFFITRKFKL